MARNPREIPEIIAGNPPTLREPLLLALIEAKDSPIPAHFSRPDIALGAILKNKTGYSDPSLWPHGGGNGQAVGMPLFPLCHPEIAVHSSPIYGARFIGPNLGKGCICAALFFLVTPISECKWLKK